LTRHFYPGQRDVRKWYSGLCPGPSRLGEAVGDKALRSSSHGREPIMNHIRRYVSSLAVLATSMLVVMSVPAFAEPIPPNDHPLLSQPVVPAHLAVSGGMPGWEITLIAMGAAVLGAALAALLNRVRSTRQSPRAA